MICLAPAGFSLPAVAALTQLRSVCSTNPSPSATRPMLPTRQLATACSLNSAVYSCFGMRFTSFFLSLCRSYDDYVGRRNSWGSSVTIRMPYLTDILTRLPAHPIHQIDELLPHRWKPKAD